MKASLDIPALNEEIESVYAIFLVVEILHETAPTYNYMCGILSASFKIGTSYSVYLEITYSYFDGECAFNVYEHTKKVHGFIYTIIMSLYIVHGLGSLVVIE